MTGRIFTGTAVAVLVVCASGAPASAAPTGQTITAQAREEAKVLDSLPAKPASRLRHPPLDHSGRKQVGKASYYAHRFDGRRMASGRRFDPRAQVAASKTLPLGTIAQVTNLQTGRSAIVTVEDRGPHVAGRVLDVSPAVAEELDMKEGGVAQVEIKPIAVPQPGGGVKLGAGAATAAADQVAAAVEVAEAFADEDR